MFRTDHLAIVLSRHQCPSFSSVLNFTTLFTGKALTLVFVLSGTLTVEQIYQDRDQFATLVREVASPDVGRMGIEILSFTIKVKDIKFTFPSAFIF